MEREYYRSAIQKASAHTYGENHVTHLTFDFAKQLELPCHTREVGPLYFKVGYRIQLFGIAEEARKRQHNYLFAEHQSIGQDGKSAHGPNNVLSMIHHHLQTTLGLADTIHLHCDNCVGQNKNKSVLAYFMWRCFAGLSHSIELS